MNPLNCHEYLQIFRAAKGNEVISFVVRLGRSFECFPVVAGICAGDGIFWVLN